MSKFLEELKRRNVIKATIAYLVVAWIIIQVAIAVLPTFGAAEWVTQAIIIILAIGLPIWIIISWIYDITPEGIAKTTEAPEKQIFKQIANKRLNVFLIVSLSIAVVVMGLKISNVFEPNTDGKYSIAVMAFENVSNDAEQEYFSDGISEEIINMLAQVPGLKVIARTSSFSFKGQNQDAQTIGAKLNVSHILEGSVRRSGNKLRITAQLINVADNSEMFSEQINRELEDIFDIQDEISAKVLESIKIKLLGNKKEAVFKNYTENIDAYQLFLKGRYHFNKLSPNDFKKAIEYFNAAIAIDPEYAIAYAGLANCNFDASYFNWLPVEVSIKKAIEYAEKAIEIDANCSDCYISSGRIKLWYDWNFPESLKELEKGIAINPNSVEGNRQLGVLHMIMENYAEANKYLQKADNLDAFSLLNLVYIGGYHDWDGDYELIIEYGNRLIELAPNYSGSYGTVSSGYFGLGNYEKAIEYAEKAYKLSNETIESNTGLVQLYLKVDKEEKAQEIFENIKNQIGEQDIANYSYGYIYANMGEWDLAFDYFNRAVINHEMQMLYLKSRFRDFYPDMVNDPRTIDLIKKIGLPLD